MAASKRLSGNEPAQSSERRLLTHVIDAHYVKSMYYRLSFRYIIHVFGLILEPRYIFHAKSLD